MLCSDEELDEVIQIRARAWKNYFTVSGLDLEYLNNLLNVRPIQYMELTLDPLCPLICSLLYIFAMETHLHQTIFRC